MGDGFLGCILDKKIYHPESVDKLTTFYRYMNLESYSLGQDVSDIKEFYT